MSYGAGGASAPSVLDWARRASPPPSGCAVDLEDDGLVRELYSLFHGSLEETALPAEVRQQGWTMPSCELGPAQMGLGTRGMLFSRSGGARALLAQDRRPPASAALQAKILSLLCKSVAAANCFPDAITVSPGPQPVPSFQI